ncbi:MAG: histone deacetylase [Proteobacteria bacterium]|nr:histone deacetylase [Pseudomonadota bacterium]
MTVRRTMAVVEDSRFEGHRGPAGHPERPERLHAVGDALAAFEPQLERLAPRLAEDDEIGRVHTADHVRGVSEAAALGPGRLDEDTYVARESAEIARLAAGGTIEVARSVARGQCDVGIAAVRPPGHHAESQYPMGFCLLNNVAIAARALQADEQVGKLMILDWDVHHGNGTQHSFDADPSVLYVSSHQYPYYPGTGDFGEAGRGPGEGTTVNVPLPAGCSDAEYVGVLQRIVVPAARAFRPELLLVSCGFDAHRDDPLASMDVTEEGFRAMGRIARALADELCAGRLVFVLEGGYALSGLREGTQAVLETALEPSPPDPPAAIPTPNGSVLKHVVGRAAAVHGDRIPDFGAA